MKFSESTNGFYIESIHGPAIPPDAVEITVETHADLLEGQAAGKRIVADQNGRPTLQDPPPLTQDQVIALYEKALDDHLDSVARLHRYENRITFALRASFPGPYQAEGTAFAQWMDTCNAQAFALLGEVQAGTQPMPTIPDFLATLPPFELP